MSEINLKKLLDEIPHKWRVQSFSKYRALATCVPYVDARDVMARLDEVVGPLYWRDEYKEVNGRLMCGVSIFGGKEWVTKWDTGTITKVEGDKGIVSDSFKRAAVKWGIGRFLYSLGCQFVPANAKKDNDKNKFPHVVDGSGKKVYDLTEYINSCLDKREPQGEEDMKYCEYWTTKFDAECQTSFDISGWWAKNHGDIGRYLDGKEYNKLLIHLGSMKVCMYETEEVICPKDETGKTVVMRIDCEKAECRNGCPGLPELTPAEIKKMVEETINE